MKLGEGASLREVSLEVTPLGPERLQFLIVVEDLAGQPEPDLEGQGKFAPAVARRTFEMRIGRLEKELAASRAHLESVIIEQEAANEEVVASNEELQSLNEELESSKEELEATNEELTTVNQELQVRNTELENSREFAQATIDTVRGCACGARAGSSRTQGEPVFLSDIPAVSSGGRTPLHLRIGRRIRQCFQTSGAARGGSSREPNL